MNKIKQFIPQLLSASRIVLSPIVIFCGITSKTLLTTILIVLGVGTDYLDGKLARKWNIKNKGKFSVDAVGDKIFIASAALALIFSNPMALIPIPLELAIGTTNLISYIKGFKPKTNKYGQIKQALLYLTYFFYSLSSISVIFKPLSIVLSALTVIAQTMALGRYINKYKEAKNKEFDLENNSIENNVINDNAMQNINNLSKKHISEIEELKKLKNSLIQDDNDIKKVYQKEKKDNL